MHLSGLQSEGPPRVFQPVGFICACHVVNVITKEEDRCKCVTTSLLQNPVTNLLAPPGGGEEKLQAGHRGLRAGLLNGSPSPGWLTQRWGGPGQWAPGVSTPQAPMV